MSDSDYGPDFPKEGEIYTIFQVVFPQGKPDEPGLILREVRSLLPMDWSSDGICFSLNHFELAEKPVPAPA